MISKVNYNMIVAFDLGRGIGKDNKLPWHFPEDLKRFSKLTRGQGNNAIIMGRNTWESLPKKPLPKRDNLILSTTLKYEQGIPHDTYIKTFSDIDTLNKFCEIQNYDTVWIIGGSKVYENYMLMYRPNNIYVTLIHNRYKCDTWFPSLLFWNLVSTEKIINKDNKDIKDNISCDDEIWYQVYN